MCTYAKEGNVADENQNLVARRFIFLVEPEKAHIRNEHQDKHGHAIDFGFHRIEPEGIGESQQETGHQGGSSKHDSADLRRNLFGKGVRLEDGSQEFPGKEGRHIDRSRRAHHGDVVYPLRDFFYKGEQHNDCTGEEHEERRSRRMRNTEGISAGHKFAAVPERDRGRHGHGIDDQGYKAGNPCKNMFHPLFFNHD